MSTYQQLNNDSWPIQRVYALIRSQAPGTQGFGALVKWEPTKLPRHAVKRFDKTLASAKTIWYSRETNDFLVDWKLEVIHSSQLDDLQEFPQYIRRCGHPARKPITVDLSATHRMHWLVHNDEVDSLVEACRIEKSAGGPLYTLLRWPGLITDGVEMDVESYMERSSDTELDKLLSDLDAHRAKP